MSAVTSAPRPPAPTAPTVASLPVGTYEVTAGAFGYATETVEDVAVTEGTRPSSDFALAPVPSGAVTGE